MAPNIIASGSGWTCSACKTWVPTGTLHMCTQTVPSTAPAPAYTYTTSAIPTDPAQVRIALALERIALSLEALVEQGS